MHGPGTAIGGLLMLGEIFLFFFFLLLKLMFKWLLSTFASSKIKGGISPCNSKLLAAAAASLILCATTAQGALVTSYSCELQVCGRSMELV